MSEQEERDAAITEAIRTANETWKGDAGKDELIHATPILYATMTVAEVVSKAVMDRIADEEDTSLRGIVEDEVCKLLQRVARDAGWDFSWPIQETQE